MRVCVSADADRFAAASPTYVCVLRFFVLCYGGLSACTHFAVHVFISERSFRVSNDRAMSICARDLTRSVDPVFGFGTIYGVVFRPSRE